MALFASLSILYCPTCGKCQNQAELQVSKDPVTGKMRAERVKKN